MTSTEAITKIIKANSIKEVFPDLANWKTTFKQFSMLIHPDKCSDKLAQDAFAKLNQYKENIEKGRKYEDDAGLVTYTMNTVTIKGNKDLLKISVDRFRYLKSLTDQKSKNFHKYLPESVELVSPEEIKFYLRERALPISAIGTLPQEHVNWILSRMLEFAAYFNNTGHVHGGINPDTIYVAPDEHIIFCTSFYHTAKIGSTMKTISAKYKNFYPTLLFSKKKATPDIDIELAKRTAVYLLGDQSGMGVKLKKTHEEKVLNFLFKTHTDPVETFLEYRKFLDANFPKKFHVLNI
jgi:hypothetical protein